MCHQCKPALSAPVVCPECGSKRIRYFGAGTERVEEAVKLEFPTAHAALGSRCDGAKGSHGAILTKFVKHEADVLIGTQMIAKGLDLPLVTLVGAIAADVGLFLPDFRASERTFQLLTQVAARGAQCAGRGGGGADVSPGALCDPGRERARLRGFLPRGDGVSPAAGVSAAATAGAAGVSPRAAGRRRRRRRWRRRCGEIAAGSLWQIRMRSARRRASCAAARGVAVATGGARPGAGRRCCGGWRWGRGGGWMLIRWTCCD